MATVIEAPIEMVRNAANLRLPETSDQRLQWLTGRRDQGALTAQEREELAALVELSEAIPVVRAQACRVLGGQSTGHGRSRLQPPVFSGGRAMPHQTRQWLDNIRDAAYEPDQP